MIQDHWAKVENQPAIEGATKDKMQPPSLDYDPNIHGIDEEETLAPSRATQQGVAPASNKEMHQTSPIWEPYYQSSHEENDSFVGLDPFSLKPQSLRVDMSKLPPSQDVVRAIHLVMFVPSDGKKKAGALMMEVPDSPPVLPRRTIYERNYRLLPREGKRRRKTRKDGRS